MAVQTDKPVFDSPSASVPGWIAWLYPATREVGENPLYFRLARIGFCRKKFWLWDRGPAEFARGRGGILSDIGILPIFLIALPFAFAAAYSFFQSQWMAIAPGARRASFSYQMFQFLRQVMDVTVFGALIGVFLIFTRALGLSARLPPKRFIRNAEQPWGDDLRLSGLTWLDIDLAVFVSSLMSIVRRSLLGIGVVFFLTTATLIYVTVITLHDRAHFDPLWREKIISRGVKDWLSTMSYLIPYLIFIFIYVQASAAYSLTVTFRNLAQFNQRGPWAVIRREASEGWSFFKTHFLGASLAYTWTQYAKTNDWIIAMVTGLLFLVPTLPILYVATRRYWSRDAGSLGHAFRFSIE